MPRWTEEAKRKQAEKIHAWKPWKTAGVKTPEGKAISSQNANKNGRYKISNQKALKQTRKLIKEHKKILLAFQKMFCK